MLPAPAFHPYPPTRQLLTGWVDIDRTVAVHHDLQASKQEESVLINKCVDRHSYLHPCTIPAHTILNNPIHHQIHTAHIHSLNITGVAVPSHFHVCDHTMCDLNLTPCQAST
jgi:hypothetical protein